MPTCSGGRLKGGNVIERRLFLAWISGAITAIGFGDSLPTIPKKETITKVTLNIYPVGRGMLRAILQDSVLTQNFIWRKDGWIPPVTFVAVERSGTIEQVQAAFLLDREWTWVTFPNTPSTYVVQGSNLTFRDGRVVLG